jgi:hypothetical protein
MSGPTLSPVILLCCARQRWCVRALCQPPTRMLGGGARERRPRVPLCAAPPHVRRRSMETSCSSSSGRTPAAAAAVSGCIQAHSTRALLRHFPLVQAAAPATQARAPSSPSLRYPPPSCRCPRTARERRSTTRSGKQTGESASPVLRGPAASRRLGAAAARDAPSRTPASRACSRACAGGSTRTPHTHARRSRARPNRQKQRYVRPQRKQRRCLRFAPQHPQRLARSARAQTHAGAALGGAEGRSRLVR